MKAEAEAGDFIFVPPFVPHQEINAGGEDTVLHCVLARSGHEAVVVNLPHIEPVEKPEKVFWTDSLHQAPGQSFSFIHVFRNIL